MKKYRVVKMGTKWYGLLIDLTDEDELNNIDIFTNEGEVVLIVNELESLLDLDIDTDDPNQFEMVT